MLCFLFRYLLKRSLGGGSREREDCTAFHSVKEKGAGGVGGERKTLLLSTQRENAGGEGGGGERLLCFPLS